MDIFDRLKVVLAAGFIGFVIGIFTGRETK